MHPQTSSRLRRALISTCALSILVIALFIAIGQASASSSSSSAGSNTYSSLSFAGGCSVPTFNPPVSYPAGGNAVGTAAGDFNEDGNPDLAVTNYNTSNISILLGNGAGSGSMFDRHPLRVVPVG